MATPAEQLLRRLADVYGLEVPPGTVIRGAYAGRVQRAAGAWSWFAVTPDGREVCGSQHRVADLLRAKRLILSTSEVRRAPEVDPAPVEHPPTPSTS